MLPAFPGFALPELQEWGEQAGVKVCPFKGCCFENSRWGVKGLESDFVHLRNFASFEGMTCTVFSMPGRLGSSGGGKDRGGRKLGSKEGQNWFNQRVQAFFSPGNRVGGLIWGGGMQDFLLFGGDQSFWEMRGMAETRSTGGVLSC